MLRTFKCSMPDAWTFNSNGEVVDLPTKTYSCTDASIAAKAYVSDFLMENPDEPTNIARRVVVVSDTGTAEYEVEPIVSISYAVSLNSFIPNETRG